MISDQLTCNYEIGTLSARSIQGSLSDDEAALEVAKRGVF